MSILIQDSEAITVMNALLVAAEAYRRDAKAISESPMSEQSKTTLSEQFERQAKQASEIANRIESEINRDIDS